MIWTFYDQLVKVEKGWVEQEFVLLIIAALPSEAGLPNEYISHRIINIAVSSNMIEQVARNKSSLLLKIQKYIMHKHYNYLQR